MGGRSYYGAIGNGETMALVGPDLQVGWLCVPRFDGIPILAGALDPQRGGGLALGLEVDGQPVPLAPAGQAYLGRSAVLVSRAAGAGWELAATDFMPWGRSGLVRRLAVSGPGGARVRVTVTAAPVRSVLWSFAAGQVAEGIWLSAPGAAIWLAADAPLAPLPDAAAAATAGGSRRPAVSAALDLGPLAAGATAASTLWLGYGPDPRAAAAAIAPLRAIAPEQDAAWWEQWLADAYRLPGPVPPRWEAAYWRSLVMLKLLTYDRTGAMIAAGTAAFPAVPGGGDNWDYRYCWLRDGYLAALALDAAGLHADARRFYDFAFSTQGPDGHWRQPLYTVDGGDPAELVAPDLAGPGGERPVRLGNAAAGQLQLDNEGSILHGLWFHCRASGDWSAAAAHWDGVRRAADWIMANWRRPESGIWELRDYVGHWVHGKALCYVALASAARLAEALGRGGEAAAWLAEAEIIRSEVLEHGWDPQRQAFVRHWGEGTPPAPIDISVLALGFHWLLPPDDPRLRATAAAMEQPADAGGLWKLGGACRWERAARPFYLPTLWLARHYLLVGRTADCDRLLEGCLDAATDLLLMAEHFDGATGEQWGNFPQAFSHLEVVRLVRERAQGWSYCNWERGAQGAGGRR